jgi:hypothetical protein
VPRVRPMAESATYVRSNLSRAKNSREQADPHELK